MNRLPTPHDDRFAPYDTLVDEAVRAMRQFAPLSRVQAAELLSMWVLAAELTSVQRAKILDGFAPGPDQDKTGGGS